MTYFVETKYLRQLIKLIEDKSVEESQILKKLSEILQKEIFISNYESEKSERQAERTLSIKDNLSNS
ncbi:MAG: hypothetical protein RLY43_1322 [Bacteroidota bacterium]|jgi:ribosomal protein S8